MDRDQIDPREAEVRALWEAGDLDGAATEAIRRYGAEIFGFLLALHGGDEDAAGEVFSTFSEQIWRGLGGFAWACSLRTWTYAVARNASRAHRRAARRWAERRVPISGCPAVAEMAARVRTETLSFLRTERRTEVARLRESLSQEDQELLILRVDRDLAWLDLARIFLGDGGATPEALQREAARLRKRFQLIKRRLLELGRQQGLLPEREG
jgi:RNA polymerase sigma-70 factor (ECF subfamily)